MPKKCQARAYGQCRTSSRQRPPRAWGPRASTPTDNGPRRLVRRCVRNDDDKGKRYRLRRVVLGAISAPSPGWDDEIARQFNGDGALVTLAQSLARFVGPQTGRGPATPGQTLGCSAAPFLLLRALRARRAARQKFGPGTGLFALQRSRVPLSDDRLAQTGLHCRPWRPRAPTWNARSTRWF